MSEKEVCANLRRSFSTPGWTLLLYFVIMNVSVTVAMFVEVFLRIFINMLQRNAAHLDIFQLIMETSGSGWGYILAIIVGFIVLCFWKKREFCFRTVWKKNRKMTVATFFGVFALFFAMQAVVQVLSYGVEMLLNLMGLSLQDYAQNSVLSGDSFSAFLYGAILAPISEEILFRGLILRTLEPFGKKFAIVTSAFFFGVFHGNIIQTPYAFLVGLILGYVTVEYSAIWAVLLHMLNNLVLAEGVSWLAEILPPGVADLISMIFIWGCAVAAIVILIVERKSVARYLKEKKIHPLCLKSFFTAPGVIVFTVVMLGDIVLTTLALLIPI